MRRVLIVFICALALTCLGGAAWAEQGGQSSSQQGGTYYGPGYHQGYGQGYGPGQGMGPGMMGGGMGGGYGMRGGMGGGYGMRGGYGPNAQGWQSMSPADRQAWRQMFQEHQKATLQLRQKLVSKQMELQTLWNGPNPDQARIRELSNQVNQLRSELGAKQNQFLLQCRQKFGDKGWSCPGGGY